MPPIPGLCYCGPNRVVYLLAYCCMLSTDGYRYEEATLEAQGQRALFRVEQCVLRF